MSLVINTNIASLNAQRNLQSTSNALSNSIPRLSSGLRINSADSGISIATRSQQISEFGAAYRNAHEGIGLVQAADSGLSTANDLLSRMRELTVQSLNTSMTANDRDSLAAELSTIKSQLLDTAGGTSYNNQKLLELGSGTPKQITVGTSQLDLSNIALISNDNPEDGILTQSNDRVSLTSDAFDISGSSSEEQRMDVLNSLDKMLSNVNTARHALGVFQGEISSEMKNMKLSEDSGIYTPFNSGASERDLRSELPRAREIAEQQAASSVIARMNNMPQTALSLLRG